MQKRVARDPAFAGAWLRKGIDTILAGDVDTGKAILRDYIKATVGFEKALARLTGTPAKSLIACMLGPRGNPQALRNLFQYRSVTCKSRRALNFTSRRGQAETEDTCLTALSVFAQPVQIALV